MSTRQARWWSLRCGGQAVSLLCPPGLVQRHREPSEDRQVRVEPYPLDPADPEREHGPLVLEPSELAFDGAALVVQRLEACSCARDERVETVSLPRTNRSSRALGVPGSRPP